MTDAEVTIVSKRTRRYNVKHRFTSICEPSTPHTRYHIDKNDKGSDYLHALELRVTPELISGNNLIGRTFRIVGVTERTLEELNAGKKWEFEIEELEEVPNGS